MKRILLATLLCIPSVSALPAQDERPRLVVLCSVDQLADWVFRAALPHMGDGGFRRLMSRGVVFDRCAFLHGCTETGPGHATLSTGAPASLHGIVRNAWWDSDSRKRVYCASDPGAEELDGLPGGGGVGPAQLLAPTLGDGVKAHLGEAAKVVSLSWKDRSAVLMGGRSADLALWMDFRSGSYVTNRRYLDTVPDWLAELTRSRPLDRWHGWRWERVAGPDAYADLTDDRRWEQPHANGDRQRTLPAVIDGGEEIPGVRYVGQAYCSPVANESLALLVRDVVDSMDLGVDVVPDLLCVGFSANDTIGHAFGPRSVEVRDALLRLDGTLAELLGFLDDRVGEDRYLFVLTADHGVGPIPEAARAAGVDAGRGLLLSRARAAAERALEEMLGTPGEGGRYVIQATAGALYFDHGILAQSTPDATARREALRMAAKAVTAVPGFHAAWLAEDLLAGVHRGDPIAEAMALAVAPGRTGDILLVPRPYWLYGAVPAGHGTPWTYDREVPLIAMGPGVAEGVRCTKAVSPGVGVVLAAHVLGIPAPGLAVDTLPSGVLRDR